MTKASLYKETHHHWLKHSNKGEERERERERKKMWKILVALSCVFSIAAAECFKETADSEWISM